MTLKNVWLQKINNLLNSIMKKNPDENKKIV